MNDNTPFRSKYYYWVTCEDCGERILAVTSKAAQCEDCRRQGSKPVGSTPACPASHLDYHGKVSLDV